MKYIKGFRQETVRAESPEVFDLKMNQIYARAAEGGKLPEIHYFDSLGLCASVRYYVNEQIPETISDKYVLMGEVHYCGDCPYFKLPTDRRRTKVKCLKENRLVTFDTRACDAYYLLLEGSDESEIKSLK